MRQHMLLFTLGPVQAFILQARKTRDLWFGSFLLSALMQVSMEGIESKLVFPGRPTIEKNIPDLPNKYIAIFATASEAVAAAQQSEKNIRDFWLEICDDVRDAVLKEYSSSNSPTRKQWDEQVKPEHVFEFFWVVVEGDVEHYPDWLHEAQFALDRRKHLRDFQQREEEGEKSTISGLRAALRGTGKTREDVKLFWQSVVRNSQLSPKDIDQEGNERLDAIDTVKRFAFRSAHFSRRLHLNEEKLEAVFPSTSSIATASFLEQLLTASEHPQLTAALAPWLSETEKLGDLMPASIPLLREHATHSTLGAQILQRDGDCFFRETFSEARLKKEFGFSDQRRGSREKLARRGPEVLSKLLTVTDTFEPPVSRPTPYYALIQMDGDKMGTLINGIESKDEHQHISRALSTFARDHVPAIVEQTYPGRLIYAGGDDVVALAPLARDFIGPDTAQDDTDHSGTTVLDLVNQLQLQYRMVVQAAVGNTERKALVTASTGIAIAHHYTALSYVRRVSQEAEQAAKNHYGRNSLVVTVLRRSGEQTRVGCRWHYDSLTESDSQPMHLFPFFYRLFKEDVLSPKCVFTLLDEAPTLVHLEAKAQESEVKRVLRRQRNPAAEARFSNADLERKAHQLVALAQALDAEKFPPLREGQRLSVELHASGRRYGLVEVLGWLDVMLFLARTRKEQD